MGITTLSKTDINCSTYAPNNPPCHLRARHLRCPVEPRRDASRRDLRWSEASQSLTIQDGQKRYEPRNNQPTFSPRAPPSHPKKGAIAALCNTPASLQTPQNFPQPGFCRLRRGPISLQPRTAIPDTHCAGNPAAESSGRMGEVWGGNGASAPVAACRVGASLRKGSPSLPKVFPSSLKYPNSPQTWRSAR